MGKPAVMMVINKFEVIGKLNAKLEGVPTMPFVVFPEARVPTPEEMEGTALGKRVMDQTIEALTQRLPADTEVPEDVEASLTFRGKDYDEALENMEKHFLQQCWSDGFPLVPPTEKAVKSMLEGTELSPDHVVGVVEPGGGEATVRKIAVNAVMAGCLPQYMPVIIAATQAITDPNFDLRGVQTTTGMVSPLLIVSGSKLIQQLNINDSFSTMGPGWRANSTIGRAIRLIMINLGYAWPGKSDMKAFGSPFKFVMLMAENEATYDGLWEPLRVTEGFDRNQPTVSALPALTWQVDYAGPDVPTFDVIVDRLAAQGRVKYDRRWRFWGKSNLVILSPDTFEPIRKNRISRLTFQKALYDKIQAPGDEFYEGREPSTKAGGASTLPQWIVDKVKKDPKALVPLLEKPESVRVITAGAPGPQMMAYVSTWGSGPAYLITKPIKLPGNWDGLLAKYKGWETPIVK